MELDQKLERNIHWEELVTRSIGANFGMMNNSIKNGSGEDCHIIHIDVYLFHTPDFSNKTDRTCENASKERNIM